MIDHKNPEPQVEKHGREYEARVRFCLPCEASDDEVEEFVQYELGGGSCSNSNPLLSTSGLHRVEVRDVVSLGIERFTDWGPLEPDGRRHGRGRVEAIPSRPSRSGVPITRRQA